MNEQLDPTRRRFLQSSSATVLAGLGVGPAWAQEPIEVPPIDARIKKLAETSPLSMQFRGTSADDCLKWQAEFSAKLRSMLGDFSPPKKWETIVESKSLKLFLGAFRNHCGFHEDVTVGIGQRLVAEMKPKWLRIGGYWYPRGGMPIDVFWQSGPPPEGLWLPDQGVAPFRGRG